MNQKLASIMNHYHQYDARMLEVHHTQKLDAPSGTALSLAEDILSELDRKNSWTLKDSQKTSKDSQETSRDSQETSTDAKPGLDSEKNKELIIEAIREGQVPGIHEVIYESEFDEISIRHSAKDRRGFAMGAVLAAEFLHNKKGFFTMKDVLKL